MPENKEIPNQNTLFSSNSQSHSPPKPAEPPKGPDAKAPPAADGKKHAEPSKAPDAKAAPTADAKKPTEPPKAPDTKAPPAADGKKPVEPSKAPDTKTAPAADGKKPVEPPKAPDAKTTPAADGKKPAEPAKAPDAKATPATDAKKPAEPAKGPGAKAAPAAVLPKTTEAAKDPVKGVKITQIFADRLEKPDEKALKDLPIPQEGEGFSIRLHPDYFFDFLDHPFTVNREVDDYKELFDSIKANGINEPVKARPREGGGLELISGHRRHDIAKQLNYPVPVIIEQVDTNDAQIECVDGNLHRQDIPTSELARAAKMKMEALARKAGRRSKMDQLTGPSKRTDQIVAEDMGMSRNQVNRLVRIDSLVPELKKRVDDKKLAFNTAVELSYLKPEEQGKVADFIEDSGHSPTLEQATQLKEASRAAQEAEKAVTSAGRPIPCSRICRWTLFISMWRIPRSEYAARLPCWTMESRRLMWCGRRNTHWGNGCPIWSITGEFLTRPFARQKTATEPPLRKSCATMSGTYLIFPSGGCMTSMVIPARRWTRKSSN